MANLTTTSYSILGILSLRPHTAYDLTQQARRSLRFIWPTSESQLYAEPKRLHREGLIRSTRERSGPQRSRQLYTITPAGREALRAWLETAPAPPAPTNEILLRVIFADGADKAALLRSLSDYREAVTAERDLGRSLIREQLEGRAPFADRANLNTLWWGLVAEQFRATLAWIEFAESEVMRWDTTKPLPFDRRTRRLARQLVEDDHPSPDVIRKRGRPDDGS